MAMRIELTDTPTDGDTQTIESGLVAFNKDLIGRSDRRLLAVLLRDENNMTVGGLSGFTARGWLTIETLFVPHHLRGQGIATRLLGMAEDEARNRGCRGAWLDTVNASARRLYERCGYSCFGKLDNLPEGHTLVFMNKDF
jgi:GNAT superfamily N-acetyltransferase